jgi:hypothetical protein
LKCGANVDKGVTLDLELSVGVAGVGDGCRGDSTESCSESLEVAADLANLWRESGGCAESDSEKRCDDDSSLHFGDFEYSEICKEDGYMARQKYVKVEIKNE